MTRYELYGKLGKLPETHPVRELMALFDFYRGLSNRATVDSRYTKLAHAYLQRALRLYLRLQRRKEERRHREWKSRNYARTYTMTGPRLKSFLVATKDGGIRPYTDDDARLCLNAYRKYVLRTQLITPRNNTPLPLP
jgi:hypothetical protein